MSAKPSQAGKKKKNTVSEQEEPIAATPRTRTAQRWNAVWAVPILAIFIGGWMLYKNVSSKGPEIRIRFDTAEGLAAGKTEIRCRSVSVGKVNRVELSEDLRSVLVYCTLDAGNEGLLRKGTRFWVVRPRVSAADVSGLGTLLTGAYIELEPGTGETGPRRWKGLETPPSTSRSVPGRRIILYSEEAGSLSVGSPIYFRGFEVGRIESRELDADGRRIVYEAFITEQYQSLVRENTRFWNTSGIDVSAGVDGFKLRTPSFQAMLTGGVSFAVSDASEPGKLAEDGMVFRLHEDEESANSSTFKPTLQVLLLFDQTVRGLSVSAPVEYRGIRIGRVTNISFDYVQEKDNKSIPVLVELDSGLLRASEENIPPEEELPRLEEGIRNGLRATLKTGSLLTGAMYVDFDYYPEEKEAGLIYKGDFPVVPTLPSGLLQIEAKLTSILDKIDKLPIDETVREVNLAVADAKTALNEIEKTAAAARATLESPEFTALPSDLRKSLSAVEKSVSSVGPDGAIQGDLLRTLDELRSAMRAVEALSNTVKEKPNSLLFGKEESKNPRPKAAPRR